MEQLALQFYTREMAAEDIPQVQALDREAFPEDWPPPDFKRELQNTMASYVVAVENGVWCPAPPPSTLARLASRLRHGRDHPTPPPLQQLVVGFCGLWFLLDEAHVTAIGVSSRYRGQGIGELLMMAAVDLAAERGCKFVTLEVRVSNTVAQSLYRKLGFIQVGVRPGYYSNNHEDAFIMTTDAITSAAFQSHFQELKRALTQKLSAPAQPR